MIITFEVEIKNLKISDEFNRKIYIICWFDCVKYEFITVVLRVLKTLILLT